MRGFIDLCQKSLVLGALLGAPATANNFTYIFDTNNGAIIRTAERAFGPPSFEFVDNINGVSVTPLSSVFNQSKYTWAVRGNLNLGATDTILFTGARAGSLVVGNKVNLARGSVVTASSTPTRLGAGSRGFGSAGGPGEVVGFVVIVRPGDFDPNGQAGRPGGSGGAGGFFTFDPSLSFPQTPGRNGGAGSDSPSNPPVTGGAGGTAAATGCFDVGVNCLGVNGNGGNNGQQGAAGRTGFTGANGARGTAGAGGTMTGSGFNTVLLGGGGGGGGGGGDRGGTGQGGFGGSGGGGGAGGSAASNALRQAGGGGGGGGGQGGQGGQGAFGGSGGNGGTGGTGAGAFEIVALGGVIAAGTLAAEGTAGGFGGSGSPGNIGTAGSGGRNGNGGSSGTDIGLGVTGGQGGPGGTGGTGGTGGRGGFGGQGGEGGGGGGGAIFIAGNSVDVAGTVDLVTPQDNRSAGQFFTSGNRGVSGVNSGFLGNVNGRYTNLDPAAFAQTSPYVRGPVFLGDDFTGGAWSYGLLGEQPGLNFGNLFDARTDRSFGAVSLVNSTTLGLSGFYDQNIVLFTNLTDKPIDNPFLALTALGDPGGPLSPQALATGGFASLTLFGGSGRPNILGQLCGGCLWAAVLPDGLDRATVNASGGGVALTSVLGIGQTAFLDTPMPAVPEPASWAMLITGFGLAGARLRRRRQAGAA